MSALTIQTRNLFPVARDLVNLVSFQVVRSCCCPGTEFRMQAVPGQVSKSPDSKAISKSLNSQGTNHISLRTNVQERAPSLLF